MVNTVFYELFLVELAVVVFFTFFTDERFRSNWFIKWCHGYRMYMSYFLNDDTPFTSPVYVIG